MSLLCSFALTAAEASFLRWASSKGVMADGVQVAKAVASGKGYGLRANRALAEGQTLVSVSAAAWTAFSAEACRANLRQQNEPLFASLAAVAHRLLPNSPRQADQFVDSLSMSLAAAYSPGPYWQLLRDNTYPFNSGTWPHPLVLHSSLLERSLGPVTSAGGVSTTATAIAKRKRFYDYAAKVLSAGKELVVSVSN